MSNHKRTIRTLSHCFYDLKYHLVWTPKYRGRVLTSDKVKSELRRIFETICKWKHWEIIELSIQDDHIHTCILATPRDSVSYMMQILKGNSSAWMKKKIKKNDIRNAAQGEYYHSVLYQQALPITYQAYENYQNHHY